MIKDETLKKLSNFLTKKCKCSTITTLNQVATDGENEKSLFIMYFIFNRKISFDLIFRDKYFYFQDFKMEKIGA